MATQKSSVKESSAQKAKTRPTKVRVKNASDVSGLIESKFVYLIHGQFKTHLSKDNQKKLVSYGPWLASVLIVIILPELMVLAKDSALMGINGFFSLIFFNQESWVIMLVLLANILLLVDGLSYLFEQKRRGWTRVYQASLITAAYVSYQLFSNPVAATLSLAIILAIIFAVLDIQKYYN